MCVVSLFFMIPGITRIDNFGWFTYQKNLDKKLLANLTLLQEIRNSGNLNSINYCKNSFYTLSNTKLSNYSKLFLFPAISERCWNNLLIDSACNYKDYGFEVYKLNNNKWK